MLRFQGRHHPISYCVIIHDRQQSLVTDMLTGKCACHARHKHHAFVSLLDFTVALETVLEFVTLVTQNGSTAVPGIGRVTSVQLVFTDVSEQFILPKHWLGSGHCAPHWTWTS